MNLDPNQPEPRLSFRENLYLDALAHVPMPQRPSMRGGKVSLVLRILIRSPGLRCTLLYRLSNLLRHGLPLIGKFASRFCSWLMRHWYCVTIAGSARIGGGLVLPHPQGIVIGGEARIGARAWIFQNVTIGGAPNKIGMATIGDDCRIHAGAVITGPVTIGDHVKVGANSVVSSDVPSHAKVRASPSTIITS